jgi:hypothetical protein
MDKLLNDFRLFVDVFVLAPADLHLRPIGANIDIFTGAIIKVPFKWQKGL